MKGIRLRMESNDSYRKFFYKYLSPTETIDEKNLIVEPAYRQADVAAEDEQSYRNW